MMMHADLLLQTMDLPTVGTIDPQYELLVVRLQWLQHHCQIEDRLSRCASQSETSLHARRESSAL